MGKRKRPREKTRSIPLSPELAEGVKRQLRAFKEKVGREPGPDDPILFDPTSDTPRPIIDEVLDQHILEALHKAQVRPPIIYAYQKTGRLVTQRNSKQLTKAELKEWNDAFDEWYRLHPDEE
jgi:hypothetical protein